jgi:hypothetical protein
VTAFVFLLGTQNKQRFIPQVIGRKVMDAEYGICCEPVDLLSHFTPIIRAFNQRETSAGDIVMLV